MEFDQNLYDRAVEYGNRLGLNCFPITQDTVGEARYHLYVITVNDKKEIIPAYKHIFGEAPWIPSGNLEDLQAKATEEREKGYHTYIAAELGNSGGYISKSILEDTVLSLSTIFHEGFHRRERGYPLNKWFEESAANVIGYQAALSFSKHEKKYELTEKVKQGISRREEFVIEYQKKLAQRFNDIRDGKEISPDQEFNNAQLYALYPYNGNYFTIKRAFEKVRSFRGFVELMSGLPKKFEDAQKILIEIAKNP